MTTTFATDNDFDNARLTQAGFEIIAATTRTWSDGATETEILWGRHDTPITETDLPF